LFGSCFSFFHPVSGGAENTGSANLGTSGPFPERQIRKGKKEEELMDECAKVIG